MTNSIRLWKAGSISNGVLYRSSLHTATTAHERWVLVSWYETIPSNGNEEMARNWMPILRSNDLELDCRRIDPAVVYIGFLEGCRCYRITCQLSVASYWRMSWHMGMCWTKALGMDAPRMNADTTLCRSLIAGRGLWAGRTITLPRRRIAWRPRNYAASMS